MKVYNAYLIREINAGRTSTPLEVESNS